MIPLPRLFKLISQRDGERVAEGCEFSNGRVAIAWQREGFPSSCVWWESIEDAIAIHTGQGSWQIVWLDELRPA